MHTVPTTPDDDSPHPLSLAAAAERHLNQTGLPHARMGEHNANAVLAAARRLIAALTIPPPAPVVRYTDGAFRRGSQMTFFNETQKALYERVTSAGGDLDQQLIELSKLAARGIDPDDVETVRRWLSDQVPRETAR